MSSVPDNVVVEASIAGQDASDPDLGWKLSVADRERVELDGRRAFFKLRQHWSLALMMWISSFIVFHIGITIAVGLGWLDFLEYQWLIPLITVENFLQIVGMGYVVVRFLYPNGIKRPRAIQQTATSSLTPGPILVGPRAGCNSRNADSM